MRNSERQPARSQKIHQHPSVGLALLHEPDFFTHHGRATNRIAGQDFLEPGKTPRRVVKARQHGMQRFGGEVGQPALKEGERRRSAGHVVEAVRLLIGPRAFDKQVRSPAVPRLVPVIERPGARGNDCQRFARGRRRMR